MNYEPRVFGDGDATVCVNAEGLVLYIGQNKVQYVVGMKLDCVQESGRVSTVLEVRFPTSHDPAVSLQIEEQIRAVRNFSWVKIQQG